MRVLITGVGDAFTSYHFGSSAAVETAQGFTMIDCPGLIHHVLRRANERSNWDLQISRITDIILTHLHGDHCNGLESFGFSRRIMQLVDSNNAPDTPRIHTTAPVAKRLWQRLAPAMEAPFGGDQPSKLEDFFDVHLIEPGTPALIAGLTVECRFTRHPIPTIGLLISDGNATLAWSGDTPFEQKHVDWLSTADVVVHESSAGPPHTPIEKLNALPDDIKAKMRLIHLKDGFDVSTSNIIPLREGEVIDL